MKFRAFLTAAALSAAVLLSGCSLGIGDAEMLRPPKITGNEAEIESLIEATAGGSYKLKYPQTGQYRSAIVTEDINNDKKDEAIAFYSSDEENAPTHMLVMYDDGKEWKISCDYETRYRDVDCIKFADYDYDGIPEIFAGFSTFTAGVNELVIFDVGKEASDVKRVDFTAPYSGFTTGDYDQDGAAEVLAFTLKTNETPAQVTLIDYDNSELYTLKTCDMDESVTKFENITSGLIDGRSMGVVVDGFTDSGYNTQVVYYNPNKRKLHNYPYTTGKKSNPTTRSYRIFSDDIDHDGYVEIPVVEDVNADLGKKGEVVAPVINWSTYNPRKKILEDDIRCITNFEYGYYFTQPLDFVGETVSVLSDNNKTLSIYALDDDSRGDLIMTIKVFDVGASADKQSGFSTIESYNQYSYAYKVEPDAPLYIDGATVKKNFSLNDVNS